MNVNRVEQGKDVMISCHGHLLRAHLPVYTELPLQARHRV